MSGIGIDLLEIERMERALARRPRLAERLFTESERAAARERSRPARFLAARFCVKEAVVKALALASWDPQDIEVVGGGDRAPAVRLSGPVAAAAARRGMGVEVSITHDRGMAAAVAVLVPVMAGAPR